MKLYITQPSPFARKCRIVMREKHIANVEEVIADPIGGDPALAAVNPLTQVPALVDDDGVAWTDSPLICARLDHVSGAPRLLPEGEARWTVLRRETIADGVLELGVKLRLEQLRPEGERSAKWMVRWREGVLRGLDAAEINAIDAAQFDLGQIATVVALSWLDFRHPDLGWREGRPKLAALQAALEQRPSFEATRPS